MFYAIIMVGLIHAPISEDSFSPSIVFKDKETCEYVLDTMPMDYQGQFDCFKITVKK